MRYLGIDVYRDDSQVVVLDAEGTVVEEKRVENTELDEEAREYTGSQAVIEAARNYYTLYETLNEALDVVEVDMFQTKAIGIAEVKNDRMDAELLAQLLRSGIVAESYVPRPEIRERWALVRGRKRLVEKRTDFKNEIRPCSISRA